MSPDKDGEGQQVSATPPAASEAEEIGGVPTAAAAPDASVRVDLTAQEAEEEIDVLELSADDLEIDDSEPTGGPQALTPAAAGESAAANSGASTAASAPSAEAPAEASPHLPSVLQAIAVLQQESPRDRIAVFAGELDLEEEPGRRGVLEHEVGHLLDRDAHDDEQAQNWYERALTSSPTLKPNLWAMRRLCRRHGRWRRLVGLIDAEVETTTSPRERAELLVEKGHLLEDQLGERPAAVEAYRAALSAHPGSLSALMALERGILREGDASQLAPLLRQMIDATAEPGRKTELLVELARIQGEQVGADPRLPFERLNEALALGVAPARVLSEIERLATARGDVGELLKGLEAQAVLAEAALADAGPDLLVDVRRRQAALCRSDDPARAAAYLEGALARAPDEPLLLLDLAEGADLAGRHDDAARWLGRLQALVTPPVSTRVAAMRARALRSAGRDQDAAAVEASLGNDPRLRLLVCVERQERAAAAGDWAALAEGHREEGEIARAAGEARWAARSFGACATLRERMGESDQALAAWGEALAAWSDDGVALDALDRAFEQRGLHAERARVLEHKLNLAEAIERGALLEELIELRLGPLEDVDGAIAAAEALSALRGSQAGGDDVGVRARLVEITRSAGRPRDAVWHMQRLAAALLRAGATADAVETELARADLTEDRLGDAAAALAAVESALSMAPEDARARSERRRLLKATGRWDVVADSLRAEVENEREPARVARLLLELAHVVGDRLGRPDEAAQIWSMLAERAPDEALTRRVLSSGPGADDNPELAARWLAAGIELAPSSERAARSVRLGELQLDRVGDPAASQAAYRRALKAGGPAAPHAALGLMRTAVRASDDALLDEALATLVPLVGRGLGAALVEERGFLASTAGDAQGAEARLDEAVDLDPTLLMVRVARLRLAARQGQPDRLAESMAGLADSVPAGPLASTLRLRALTLAAATGRTEPGAPALALGQQLGDPQEATAAVVATLLGSEPEALERRASHAGDGVGPSIERVEALLSRGRLAAAAAIAQELLASDPGSVVLLELTERIAASGGDRLSQARAQHRLALALTDSERAARLLAAAAAALEALDHREEAAQAWRSLAGLRPDDEAPFHRAVALVRELGELRAHEELLSARLRRELGDGERAALLIERGRLLDDSGRPRAAAADFGEALAKAPADPQALEALAVLRARAGERASAAELFERRLSTAPLPEGESARALLERLLAVYRDLGDLHAARRTLERLVALAPGDPGLREQAADVLGRLGESTAALSHLEARAALPGDIPGRARAELQSGLLYLDALRDPAQARAAFQRALALEPLELSALGAMLPLCSTPEARAVAEDALGRAVQAARASLDRSPADAATYQALARLFSWQSDLDGRQRARQVLAALGEGPLPPRSPEGEPGAVLPPELYVKAFSALARGAALVVWREAQEAAQRLLGPEAAAVGMGRSTRQNERAAPAAWQTVDRLARAVGLTGHALHAVAGAPETCTVVGDAIALGSAYAGSPGAAERFRLVTRLCLLRDRLGPVEQAPEEVLDRFFAACGRVAEAPPPRSASALDTRVDEQARQVGKILDRRSRKALHTLAPLFAEIPPASIWRRDVLHGARCVALAVVGDLAAALSVSGLGISDPAGQALLRFFVSEEAGAMRRALGVRS